MVDHPIAEEIMYNKEFLYCLNTSNKIMEINGFIFSDWDEIIEDKLSILNKGNNSVIIPRDLSNGIIIKYSTTKILNYSGSFESLKFINEAKTLEPNKKFIGNLTISSTDYDFSKGYYSSDNYVYTVNFYFVI